MSGTDRPPERASGEEPEPAPPSPTVGAAAQARAALERAREGARSRGATQKSATQAARERASRRSGRESTPYGSGRDPEPVAEGIAQVIRQGGWAESLEIAGVTARWREVVGDAIADHTAEVTFAEGELRVVATTTAWATQLGTLSGRIRQAVNEAVGRAVVRDIRVVGPTGRSWTKGPRSVKGRGPRDTYG